MSTAQIEESRANGVKLSNSATSRASQHTKHVAGSFVAHEICFGPTMLALSNASTISHVPAFLSIANSSAIAFSHNSHPGCALASAKLRLQSSMPARLSRPSSHIRPKSSPSRRHSRQSHRVGAYPGSIWTPSWANAPACLSRSFRLTQIQHHLALE